MLKHMTGYSSTRRRAASRLCLLAVTVLLAGLAITAGVQCSDGMTMPLVPTSSLHDGSDAGAEDPSLPAVTGAVSSVMGVVSAADGSMPMTSGMLVGTCMALLAMALLAVAVTIRRSLTQALPLVAAVRRVVVPPLLGAPSLARLCVLRT